VLQPVETNAKTNDLRRCPQCGSAAFDGLPRYSLDGWNIVTCSSCGFVYLQNPPKYASLVDNFAWEKTRDAEVKRRRKQRPIRKWLDESTRWRSNLFRRSKESQLKSMFEPGPILDVGCGAGRKISEPFVPFGIEISRELAAQAQSYMGPRGGKAIHAPALEGIRQFEDKTFTGIMLRSFLEHEVEPKKLLEEAARVLADNGRIYVRVPNFGSINRRATGAQWCGFRYPDHVNYSTPKALRAMAADCGLSVRLLNPLLFVFNDNINAILVPKG